MVRKMAEADVLFETDGTSSGNESEKKWITVVSKKGNKSCKVVVESSESKVLSRT